MANVPVSVQNTVKRYLETLKDSADLLARGRSVDSRFGGGGRYEWELWSAIIDRDLPAMREALDGLRTFRELAPKNGVDADAFLASLGGVPSLAPSAKAIAFVTDDGRHTMPEKFAAYMKEFAS